MAAAADGEDRRRGRGGKYEDPECVEGGDGYAAEFSAKMDDAAAAFPPPPSDTDYGSEQEIADPPVAEPERAHLNLKVMTYNVMAPCNVVLGPDGERESDLEQSWIARNRKVVAVLDYHRPDIICLQEYWLDPRCHHELYYTAMFNDYSFSLLDRKAAGLYDAAGRNDGLATLVCHKQGLKIMDEVTLPSGKALFQNGFQMQIVLVHRMVDTGRPGEGCVKFPLVVANVCLCDRFQVEQELEQKQTEEADLGGDAPGGHGSRRKHCGEGKYAEPVQATTQDLGLAQALAVLQYVDEYLESRGLLEVPVVVAGVFNGCGSLDAIYDYFVDSRWSSCFKTAVGREVEVTHRTASGRYVAADFVWQRRCILRCNEDALAIRTEMQLIKELKEKADKRVQWEHMLSKGAGGKKQTVAQRRAAAERKRGMMDRKKREQKEAIEMRRLFNLTVAHRSSMVLRMTAEEAFALPRACSDLESILQPCLHDSTMSGEQVDAISCCSPDDMADFSDVSDHRPVVIHLHFTMFCREDAAQLIQAHARGRQQRKLFKTQLQQKKMKDAMDAYDASRGNT